MRFVKHFFPLEDHRDCRDFLRRELKLLFQTQTLQVFSVKFPSLIPAEKLCLKSG